jgi:hypothetical protein
MLLITGLLEVPLGLLALIRPGETLTAFVIVGGLWAVLIGVTRAVLSFEVRRLPYDVDVADRRRHSMRMAASRSLSASAKPALLRSIVTAAR